MNNMIEVRRLKKYFKTPRGMCHAVDDVSLAVERGKTLGVVGESGCGKSTLGRTMIRILDSTEGKILLNGEDITNITGSELKKVREKMQIIFQDPYSSLNPRLTARETIEEVMKISGRYPRKEIGERANAIMNLVGIDNRIKNSFPHELDGGRRQRIGIARALALNPELVICDEPVSALDVSIQAQVLNLLQDLQDQMKLTYIFITHDLSVVRYLANQICVMYLGQVVELSDTKEVFERQLHPYTKALLSAIPVPDIHTKMKREILRGEVTSPIDPKPGCRFAARCRFACERCSQPQELREVSPGHFAACCRVDEIN
ncbi:MAG: ATP-binding cassette domain-containing protein [Clostridiales bacterium]|nr:ATP-binding cassette domain-containing protein [Clostridiales bacterium]